MDLGLTVLRAYAQILFSRSPWVGLCLVAATASEPRSLVGGLAAVLASIAAAYALGLDREAIRSGVYGYNALLVGLGCAQTFTGHAPVAAAIVLCSAATVVIAAGMRGAMSASGLPFLSLPFLVVFYSLLFAAPALGLEWVPAPLAEKAVPPAPQLLLEALGGFFFLPRWHTGALVMAALLLESRISALLAAAGVACVLFMVRADVPPSTLESLVYNGIFTAIGLGGVWFVPSLSSAALAMVGVLLAGFLGLGLLPPLARLGAPILVLPFNVVALMVLFATRQRIRDRHPKAVDFIAGSPEENLAYFRTRVARFRALYPVRFHLPFRGSWVCTQGVDGEHSHRGQWRHAFDFEIVDNDGRKHSRGGEALDEYHCFRLPVLAPAAGTVVKAEGRIPDNAVGQMNLQHNWGNFVLIHHGPGLYSLLAHLAEGSLTVFEGQSVRRGEVLGLCGNSGRSAVPHLHFQLQGTHLLGAPTIPSELNDVVAVAAGKERVETALAPALGSVARNLAPDDDTAAYFVFPYGETWTFAHQERRESVLCDIDVYGQLLLRSQEHGATLVCARSEDFFTSYDAVGSARSLLHVLRAALPRAPLEGKPGLAWRDFLPPATLRSGLGGAVVMAAWRFVAARGLELELSMKREGELLVVTGVSTRKDGRGEPIARTRAELARGGGPVRLEVVLRGRRTVVERISKDEPAAPGEGADKERERDDKARIESDDGPRGARSDAAPRALR